jgi:hypothetical protein
LSEGGQSDSVGITERAREAIVLTAPKASELGKFRRRQQQRPESRQREGERILIGVVSPDDYRSHSPVRVKYRCATVALSKWPQQTKTRTGRVYISAGHLGRSHFGYRRSLVPHKSICGGAIDPFGEIDLSRNSLPGVEKNQRCVDVRVDAHRSALDEHSGRIVFVDNHDVDLPIRTSCVLVPLIVPTYDMSGSKNCSFGYDHARSNFGALAPLRVTTTGQYSYD